MKKTLRMIGLCALVALAATSCKKEEQKLTNTFTAELTQPTDEARTHIGSGNYLYWNNGDAFKVFDASGASYLFTTTDNNVKVANFTSNDNLDENETYCAFYPAANASGLIEGNVILTLANEQNYAVGSFANGTYPMAAVNSGTSFTFHSPCGLLAIPLKGTGTIGSIELTGKLNEPLAGQLLINPVGFDPNNPTFTLGNFQTTVTLNCGGVALNADNATSFYFVVPKNVFSQGFTAVVKGLNGSELYRLETTQNNVITAENIRLMPVVTVTAVGVTTGDANITDDAVVINGSYEVPAGMTVSEVGFYWGADATNMTKVQAEAGNPFSFTLEQLDYGTYSYQAYAMNGENEYVGSIEEFTLEAPVVVVAPTVTTAEVTEITTTAATVGGTITDAGNGTISESGICYKTGNAEWTCVALEATENAFSTTLTELTPNTTYTVRAYATNEEGTGYGEEVTFTTEEEVVVTVPTVTTNAVTSITTNSALVGGAITNDGNGTVTESGICYKTGSEEWACVAIAATNNAFSMTLIGLTANTTYTVRAYATNEEGTGYGEEVSFITIDLGIINGAFTINANGDQVYFSKGNLQYTKSTQKWRFMEHQFDMVETNGQDVGTDYANQDVISLFGWGTSGYNHGAVCYQPWCTNNNDENYYAYGQSTYNLYDQTGQADWGYNAIVNGNNAENSGWRTLTSSEWQYLFNRYDRCAKGSVNGVNGVILLPDNWNSSVYSLNYSNSSYSNNTISATDWTNILEINGAVFLPGAGRRWIHEIDSNNEGMYWSASVVGSAPYYVFFGSNFISTDNRDWRCTGYSVRLVRPVQ